MLLGGLWGVGGGVGCNEGDCTGCGGGGVVVWCVLCLSCGVLSGVVVFGFVNKKRRDGWMKFVNGFCVVSVVGGCKC